MQVEGVANKPVGLQAIGITHANPDRTDETSGQTYQAAGHDLVVCYRQPLTPRLPKYVAILVVGYVRSDPDFILVLGYLDDVTLVQLGIMPAILLMPAQVLAVGRQQAIDWQALRSNAPSIGSLLWWSR